MFAIIHIIVSLLLGFCIVVQNRSSGLSATFGGSGSTTVVQRRGAEMLIYKVTIYLAIAFFGLSIIRWYF